MAYKGFFKPKNPQKYMGNTSQIIYRSRWELKFMTELDLKKEVISWGSEEIIVPYRSPKDNRIHRYFVDFIVIEINNGKKQTTLYEIKPAHQTKKPVIPKKQNKKFIVEAITYAVNEAKWKAAREYCLDRGWKFEILTEKELGITF